MVGLSLKSKGIDAERELLHKFWGVGNWSAVRVAGSGSMRYPSADILASNKIRRLAIECKTSIDKCKYLSKEQVGQLKEFAELFGAEPWIAIKFKGYEWHFISLSDLIEKNKSYVIDLEGMMAKGLLFEEMVDN